MEPPTTKALRKPSVPRRGQGGSCVDKPRQKTDRKPTLRSRLWNSVKRTVKRNSVVGPSSRGSVDVEASDFSYRQPPRGSPVSWSHKKKGSPSLELHSGKRRSRSSLAIEVRPRTPVTVGLRSSEASLYEKHGTYKPSCFTLQAYNSNIVWECVFISLLLSLYQLVKTAIEEDADGLPSEIRLSVVGLFHNHTHTFSPLKHHNLTVSLPH